MATVIVLALTSSSSNPAVASSAAAVAVEAAAVAVDAAVDAAAEELEQPAMLSAIAAAVAVYRYLLKFFIISFLFSLPYLRQWMILFLNLCWILSSIGFHHRIASSIDVQKSRLQLFHFPETTHHRGTTLVAE
jgi:hypothetical protein